MSRLLLCAVACLHAFASALAAESTDVASDKLVFDLLFDGKRIQNELQPQFSCANETTYQYFACNPVKRDDGLYEMNRLAPGKYSLHAFIDSNQSNDREYPGDFTVQHHFEITADSGDVVQVNMPKVLHLLKPVDNRGILFDHLNGPCGSKRHYVTPRFALRPHAAVDLEWEPVVEGAEYGYNLYAIQCNPPYAGREIATGKTLDTHLTLDVPPSDDDEYYSFRFWAHHNDRIVGDFFVHDVGSHSWNYRFRVTNGSIPLWIYPAGLLAMLLIILAYKRSHAILAAKPAVRRGVIGSAIGIVLICAAIAGYQYRQTQRRAQAEAAAAAAQDALQATEDRKLRDELIASLPKLSWWDEVTPAAAITSLPQLYAAWEARHENTDGKNREFFKAAYTALIEHPNDIDLVITSIKFIKALQRDDVDVAVLYEFALERHFNRNIVVRGCYSCKPGDWVLEFAGDLASFFSHRKRDQADRERALRAVDLMQRAYAERSDQIAEYLLVDKTEVLADAQWSLDNQQDAIDTLQSAIAKYASSNRTDSLKRSVARYKGELAKDQSSQRAAIGAQQ